MTSVFDHAETFIWSNARLLERRLFAYHFRGGARQAVLAALRAYQNEDGGFGQALEPDIRCPDSQPVPVQHALEILDAVGSDAEIVRGVCDFLTTITTVEGGVPFVLPTARTYPHAPWWNTDDDPPASLNPTAAIVGLLHKLGVDHSWMKGATAYCWGRIATLQPSEMHEMGVVITFLRYIPERQRAERELERLGQQLLGSGLVADISATDYVRKPLDWAPTGGRRVADHLAGSQSRLRTGVAWLDHARRATDLASEWPSAPMIGALASRNVSLCQPHAS